MKNVIFVTEYIYPGINALISLPGPVFVNQGSRLKTIFTMNGMAMNRYAAVYMYLKIYNP